MLDDDDDFDVDGGGGAASAAWPKSRTSKLSEAVAAAAATTAVPLPLPPSPKTRVGLLPGARFLQENALGVHTSATNEDGLRLSHLGDNFRDNNLLLIYSTPG